MPGLNTQLNSFVRQNRLKLEGRYKVIESIIGFLGRFGDILNALADDFVQCGRIRVR